MKNTDSLPPRKTEREPGSPGLLSRAGRAGAVVAALVLLATAAPDNGVAQQGPASQAQTGGDGTAQPAETRPREGGQRAQGGGGRAAAVVQADRVVIQPVTQTLPVLGRLVPRQTSLIAARTAGPIETMHVDVGDRVKQGDVLASLVSDTISWRRELRESEVAQYKASIAAARAQLAKADNEMRRMSDLQQSAAFSKARHEDQLRVVENARATLEKSLAELRQAEANLKLAEIDMQNAQVRAPFGGVITQRHTHEGAYVTMGGPVITLLNDAEMEVEADVPANRLAGLRPGTAIDAEIDQNPIRAVVRAIVPDENPLARTRAVRLTPSESLSDLQAAANQSVLLRIPIGAAREALSVHKDAVLQRGGTSVVFVIAGNGRAELRRVVTGEPIGNRFEVLEGLADGELAITRGNERLNDGQNVRILGEDNRGAETGGRQQSMETN